MADKPKSDRVLLTATLAVLAMIAAAALFLIAPVWQPSYRPAAYRRAEETKTAKDERANPTETGSAEPTLNPTESPSSIPYQIDLNHAGLAELETLPGVGKAKAQAILDDRAANGPFASLADAARVKGISEKMLDSWAGLACAN